jgi:hypothetical protein
MPTSHVAIRSDQRRFWQAFANGAVIGKTDEEIAAEFQTLLLETE